jgi:class 3 adenylate cyclase
MKNPAARLLLTLLLGLSAGALRSADQAAAPATRVTVVFDHPEKFTDLKAGDSDEDNERGARDFLPQLKEHLEGEAGRLLGPGQKLTVTFTDIDLAGAYEPWRGPQFSDVRIIKDIYPPRLVLTFVLTGADGKVLKQGPRQLSDMAFLLRITRAFRDDPLRYEKELLDDWLATELRDAKH